MLPIAAARNGKMAGYFFLYCLGFFILLLCLDINVWLAIIGSFAYAFSSYFLILLEAF